MPAGRPRKIQPFPLNFLVRKLGEKACILRGATINKKLKLMGKYFLKKSLDYEIFNSIVP